MILKGYFPIKEGDLSVMIGAGFFLSSLFSVIWGWVMDAPPPPAPSLTIAGFGFFAGRLLTMHAEKKARLKAKAAQE